MFGTLYKTRFYTERFFNLAVESVTSLTISGRYRLLKFEGSTIIDCLIFKLFLTGFDSCPKSLDITPIDRLSFYLFYVTLLMFMARMTFFWATGPVDYC